MSKRAWTNRSSHRNALILLIFLVVTLMLETLGCVGLATANGGTHPDKSKTPGINTSSLPDGTVGSSYSSTLSVSGGTPPYTWSVASGKLPTGLTLGSSSGTISGTPTLAGKFTFTVQVQDSGSPSHTASKELSITIAASLASLEIATSSLPDGQVSSSYSATLKASGGTTPYSWSVSSGALPAGLKLDASTGVLAGTPTQSGSFTVTVKVQDSSSPALTATEQFSFSITTAVAALQIATNSLPQGHVKASYSATLKASGGTTPYSWSITSGTLPSGLTLDASTGAITGIPTQSGSFTLTIQVQDSGSATLTASKQFSLSIAAAVLQIATTSLPNGKVKSSYSVTLKGTGGTTPYTWSISSGALPAGLGLSASTGLLAGTPTQSGSFTPTIEVQDSSSSEQNAKKQFSLSIAVGPTPLQILTTSLPGGQVGSTYSAPVSASGGVTPYNWSIIAGALPSGLTLSSSTGQITGTPSASGTFSFTMQVTDSSSPAQTAEQVLSLVIAVATSGTPITDCGILGNSGTTYVLQNDVSSAGTCFAVRADDVTLDLNGHTVTYGTANNSKAVAGILGVYCWDPVVSSTGIFGSSAPCGGPFNDFTVTNSTGTGRIQEGAGPNGSYSTAIYMGQNVSDGPNVNNVTLVIHAVSAYGIYANYAGGSFAAAGTIHDVVCNNNSTAIVDRFNIENLCVKLDNAGSTTGGFTVYNVTQNGGVQGGIFMGPPGSEVKNNTVKLSHSGQPTGYTNDYAFYIWGKNLNVHDNTVENVQGRGFQFYAGDNGGTRAAGSVAQNNHVLAVSELPNNAEYGGCELDGAFGVNFKYGPQGTTFLNNDVVVQANQCSATGLRVVGFVWPNELSKGNTYTAQRTGSVACNALGGTGSCAFGFSLNAYNATDAPFTSENDTFTADTADGWIDWDGCDANTRILSPTFNKGSNPANDFVFLSFSNGADPCILHFRDATFGSGVSPTSTNMHLIDANHQLAQYFIDWTYTVTVTRSSDGLPVSGAAVISSDGATGAQDCSTVTDGSGVASCVFTQLDMKNSASVAQINSNHNPHAVTISATGCSTLDYGLTITGTTSDSRTLTCP